MEDTKLRLMLDYAFFGTLALSKPLIADPHVRTLATNGSEIRYAPQFIDTLNSDQKLFGYLHEIAHIVLGHPFRRGNRDHRLFNIAADYAANALILKATGLEPPPGCLYDPKFEDWSTERIYEHLLDEFEGEIPQGSDDDPECDTADLGDGEGEGDGEDQDGDGDSKDQDEEKNEDDDSGSDQDSENQDPENQDSEQEQPEEESEKEKKFRKMYEAAQVTGLVHDADEDASEIEQDANTAMAYRATAPGTGGIEGVKELVKDITETKISWVSELSKFINETSTNYYNWNRPNQRYSLGDVIIPSLQSDDTLEMVVTIDTSGSIDKYLLGKFMQEFKSITSAIEYKQIHVLSCHTRAYNWKTYQKGMDIDYEPHDYGGTAFAPAFEMVKDKMVFPACLIYFTDLECSPWHFGPDPQYPVLWVGNFTDTNSWHDFTNETLPFGTMIDMGRN